MPLIYRTPPTYSAQATNAAAISVIDGFNISERVPLDGQVSYEELSTAVGIPRTDLKSILRMAMTDFVFHEPSPGFVAHTAASRVLVDSPLARSLVKINIDEMMPAMSKVHEKLRILACKIPLTSDSSETLCCSTQALKNPSNQYGTGMLRCDILTRGRHGHSRTTRSFPFSMNWLPVIQLARPLFRGQWKTMLPGFLPAR